MAKDRDENEIPESEAGAVTPAAALEDTLGQRLGTFPGDATRSGFQETAEPSEFSFWPITSAFSVLLIGIGFLFHMAVAVVGAIILMVALVGWFTEPWVS